MEEFETLLDEYFTLESPKVGNVVKGKILAIESGQVIIDVGSKVEGRIDYKEFTGPGNLEEVTVGDEVDVYYESVENGSGLAVISRERARREEAWERLLKAHENNEKVEGSIVNRVKGGFTVDLGGVIAFLPGSQVNIRPMRDIETLMGTLETFAILKMDRDKNNIVVSRRAILEESRAELRAEIVNKLTEGEIIEGTVKNITDYGAFVDLGGVDGLLHITDMSWGRIKHPSEVVSINKTVKVRVVNINQESQRISLGIKQLREDPWLTVDENYPVQTKHKGHVTNITDYGAFVELEPGIEGLIHISEMSWNKKNSTPSRLVSTSQEVEVMILDIDKEKRRISLGLKQTMPNPWQEFAEKYPRGTRLEGEIKNITEFGLFVGLDYDIDGMIHLSDLSWDKPGSELVSEYNPGDVVEVVVSEIDVDKERVALSIKDLEADPFLEATSGLFKGKTVTVNVTEILDNAIEVELKGITTIIKRNDLGKDMDNQLPSKFKVGQEVEAQITHVDSSSRKLGLSIRLLEMKEAKEAVEKYSSNDTGGLLGDILGEALESKNE
ncbi:MAG: 30S ribosomal protein S1 [Paracoccaceae bacterium]|nr:30S ribosomal protein S1 [Paracoccaceae bacterium]MDE2673505.1 30S ribosomal protein S1 [Paracoccaceae bacterium]MXZ51315.1 30S ribosomal protein S1 [Paracoccaceae bacterium]MYF45410.1 30S ribosomal protein S1 [Paracoccaceae bacterium]MYG10225.1 30S ribosomal protein S1 [Paracoccaceae bacterium]